MGWENLLEKEMAVHSGILAWKIPWPEEPLGLQSMGHKESNTTERIHTHTHTHTHTLCSPLTEGQICKFHFLIIRKKSRKNIFIYVLELLLGSDSQSVV